LPGHDAAQNALRRGVHWRSAQTIPAASALSGCLDGTRRHPGTVSGGRNHRICSRIARNSHCGTATSAIWKNTYRECVTTFAPILMSFSRSPDVHRDQRPVPHRPRQRQAAEEVAQVVREPAPHPTRLPFACAFPVWNRRGDLHTGNPGSGLLEPNSRSGLSPSVKVMYGQTGIDHRRQVHQRHGAGQATRHQQVNSEPVAIVS